jgi:hypothetical protein
MFPKTPEMSQKVASGIKDIFAYKTSQNFATRPDVSGW